MIKYDLYILYIYIYTVSTYIYFSQKEISMFFNERHDTILGEKLLW